MIEKLTSVPVITSFSPVEGAAGTEVTITGKNLAATTLVSFSGTPAVFSIDSNKRVTAEVPGGASSGKILVANSDGNAQSADDFVVLAPPVLTSFSPASGSIGEQVTVFGSGFEAVTDVLLNGTVASFTVISDSEIQFPVPAGATSGALSLTSPGGTATSTADFEIIRIPAISSFNPASGVVGDEVTIVGVNFNGATEVSFSGTSAQVFAVDSDTQVRTEVPPGATSGALSVTNAAGSDQSGNSFTVIQPPTIAGFTPENGPVGTEVTITGTNFLELTEVSFNGAAADDFTVDSDSVVRADVPVGAATGPIRVGNVAGSGTSAPDFGVLQVPVIAAFSPGNGPVGTEVTISGSDLSGVTDVLFDGVSTSSLNIDSDLQLRAIRSEEHTSELQSH